MDPSNSIPVGSTSNNIQAEKAPTPNQTTTPIREQTSPEPLSENLDQIAQNHAFVWLTMGLDQHEIMRRLQHMGLDATQAETMILLGRKKKTEMEKEQPRAVVTGVNSGQVSIGLLCLLIAAVLTFFRLWFWFAFDTSLLFLGLGLLLLIRGWINK